MTFLAIVQSKGFPTINAFLDSCPDAIAAESDLTDRELKAVRSAEAATEACFGNAA